MKTVQHTLICLLLAALIAATVQGILLIRAATDTVDAATAAALDLPSQINATRAGLILHADQQVSALRSETLARVDAALSEVREIRKTADRRIGDTLTRADSALGKVEEIRTDIKPTLAHAESVTAQIDSAAPLFLDCDHNPDCVFNRFQGTSKAIEQMTQAGAKAAPQLAAAGVSIAKSADDIAADVKREADELTKPKRWYQKALGPVYTAGRLVAAFL